MTYITFIVIIVVLFILLGLNSIIREYIKVNKYEIKDLQNSLKKIENKLDYMGVKNPEPEVQKVKKETPVSIPAQIKTEEKTYFESILEPYEEVQKPENIREVKKLEPIKETKSTVPPATKKVISQERTYKPSYVEESKPFMERYPDLEKFIGENLINKIGIVILVLGIAFLVKYAIDKNWINEVGRIAIGILSAGALIGLAHKLRKDYKPFSSVLIGGGLALLYLTITLAYHTEGYPLYQQQTTSFIILIFITLFAVFLSIAYNRIEIAILAILGGFGSPLMLSSGSGNYIVLFTYMMLLNVGMLVLSYYKKWRLVNIVAFAFTVLLFGSWLISELANHSYSNFSGAIFFATVFYVIFFLMNIIYNIKNQLKFKLGDISLILSNTFIFFTFGMLMLAHIDEGAYKGLFSILLGIFNFGFAYYIHKQQKADNNLLYLLIALVFTFVTLAVPLQLQGNYITLFWAAESALLLWLGQKSGFNIMKLGFILVTLLMLISLAMDWSGNYSLNGFASEGYVKQLSLIMNRMFITTLIAGGALIATNILLKKEKDFIGWIFPVQPLKSMLFVIMLLVFYGGGFLELNYQTHHYFIESSSQSVLAFAYNACVMLFLLVYAKKLNIEIFSIAVAIISTLFVFVFLFALSGIYSKNAFTCISGGENLPSTLLLLRWISIFAVYAISLLLFSLINQLNNKQKDQTYKFNITFLIFTILYLLSADLDTIAVIITKSRDILTHTQKTGYAILWGISSFVLMIIGMKRKEQIIRILSLVLFALTIMKLFVYDIRNISEAGKIVAFILLGILLLIISFMYQKVKKLVVDETLSDASTASKNPISNNTL